MRAGAILLAVALVCAGLTVSAGYTYATLFHLLGSLRNVERRPEFHAWEENRGARWTRCENLPDALL